MGNKYTLGSVKHGTNVIDQITAAGFGPGLNPALLGGSGYVDPGMVVVPGQAPSLSFTTTAIKTALEDLGGIAGIAIAASNFLFYLTQVVEGGLRAGAGAHIKGTVVAGLVIPMTLRLPLRGVAELSYQVIMTSADGLAAPVAFAGSQNLEAGQANAAEAFTLGAVSLNGTTLDLVGDVVIDFGISPWIDGGPKYPTHVAIGSRQPRITIPCRDMDQFVSMGIAGAAQGVTDSTIAALGLTAGGGYSGADLGFAVDEGILYFENADAAAGQAAEGNIIIVPTSDEAADIIAITGLS